MLLEAQFGPNIAPIERPKLQGPAATPQTNGTTPSTKPDPETETETDQIKDEEEEDEEDLDETDLEAQEKAELARLRDLGIPVPGIEIKVDKHVARVWLETLEVECAYSVLRDRVKVVVERAVETVADMWSAEPKKNTTTGEKGGGVANEYAERAAGDAGNTAMMEQVKS